MTTVITITCECGFEVAPVPTTIPETGSLLRHATTVDTLILLFENHECPLSD